MAITGNLGDIRKSAYLEMRDVIIPNEIKERKEADKALDSKIEEEKKAREKGDGDLQKLIEKEEKARESADDKLGDKIDTEANTRQRADEELDGKIGKKADKGTVSSIDELYLPGIYHPAKSITITYTKIDGTEVNTSVDTLIVSANEIKDSNGRIKIRQTAIVDADDAYFCILTRLGDYKEDTEHFHWEPWDRTDEDIFKEFRGTLKYPLEVAKEQLDKTWQTGWYMCNFMAPGENEGNPQHLVQVINERDYDDNYMISQILYDDNLPKYYRWASADTFDGYAGVLDESEFCEWLSVTPQGNWSNPFVVKDKDVMLSSLTTPGVYYFDFDDEAEIADGTLDTSDPDYSLGIFNRGYMIVGTIKDNYDNVGATLIWQKIFVGDKGNIKVYIRQTEPSDKLNYEDWVPVLSKEGSWADPYLIKDNNPILASLNKPGVYLFASNCDIKLVNNDKNINYGYIADNYMIVGKFTYDYENGIMGRTPKQKLWQQIILGDENGNPHFYIRTCSYGVDRTTGNGEDWIELGQTAANEAKIRALENKIDAEIERSKGVESSLSAAFNAELIKRAGEDDKLQSQIDELKAAIGN